VFGGCNAYVAELWGVFEGLQNARSLGVSHIEHHVDLAIVLAVLVKGGCGSPSTRSIVLVIHRLLELDWEVTIHRSYREV